MKNLVRMCLAGVMVLSACMIVSAKDKEENKGNWRGVLAAAPATAAANVVATFTCDVLNNDKPVSLMTTNATLAASVKDLAAKGATVVIRGEKSADGLSVTVKDCQEKKAKDAAATKKDK